MKYYEKYKADESAEIPTCKVCGEEKRLVSYPEILDKKVKVLLPRSCKCIREKNKSEELARQMEKLRQRTEKLKKYSLLSERFKAVTFKQTDIKNESFRIAFNRCKKYCEIYEEVREKGQGIYLYGNSGVGKTHITACMANDLMTKGVPVLFTNLFEISKAVKSTFNKNSGETELSLTERFSKISFLFFDDLGSEIFTKNQNDNWLNGLLFDLINKRYNANKPTIFSSNYSLDKLEEIRGIHNKIIDRIAEMTSGAVMQIEGKSRRNIVKAVAF
jgi:DNA replication protein DnaC